MTRRHTLPLAIAVLAGLAPGGARAEVSAETMRKANIVFIGTVQKKGESRLAGVPASSKTVVVQIERVVEKPAAITLGPKDEVTVVAKDPASLREGDRAIFYTQGYVNGESVAVTELDHERAGAEHAAAERAERGGAESKLADEKLRERVDKADTIVVGRVTAVRPLAAEGTPRRERGAGRISEHDPQWQNAVIQVESAIKGAAPREAIVVRFPASDDVAFKRMPKLRAGQSGTFLLQKEQIAGQRAERGGGREVTTYRAVAAEDVLSRDEAARVRTLAGQ